MRACLLALVVIVFASQSIMSQTNRGYSLEIKGHYQLNESDVEGGFVDIYNVFPSDTSSLPKYLVYIMKNAVESDIDLQSLQNHETQLKLTEDLNCKIIDRNAGSFSSLKGVELKVDYSERNLTIIGCLFMSVVDDSLFRVLVMMPTEEYYNQYYSEFRQLIESIKVS